MTTWNVNGVRARAAQILDWIQTDRPDVLALQETKASPADVPAVLADHGGYACRFHGHKGYSGVALLLRKGLFGPALAFHHPSFDHQHRIVAARAGSLLLASIYVPNGKRDYATKVRFLEAMERWVAEEHAAGTRLLLCGDLNVAHLEIDVHPRLRRPNEIGQTPEERALFDRLLAQGLVDLGRRFAPDDDRLFTWWAPWRQMRERNIGWRLDYVLASEPLARLATRCGALRDYGTSDHGPVTAELDYAPARVDAPDAASASAAPAVPPVGQLTLALPPSR